MLRVAIDAGPLRGPRTGVSNSIAWTFEALDACARTSHPNDIEVEAYVVSLRSRRNADERRIPMPAKMAQWTWARGASPRVDRWLGNPDVVHGTNYVVPPARAARLVTVHDCWFLEHPSEADPALSAISAVLSRAIADGAHVLTCSEATSRRVRDLFDARSVETLYHGPPPNPEGGECIAPTEGDPDAPFVLALGTIERRKNLPSLINAFALVAENHPTLELRLAGRDGDDSLAVSSAVDQLSPSSRRRVVRHPHVTEATKRWLLDHASVLAYPSLDEGFGIPILEAQQAGVPVVGSSAGSIPEIAGEGGLFSSPLDVQALADNLLSAVLCDETRTRLISFGRLNLERFSWERTAEQLRNHYRRAAADV